MRHEIYVIFAFASERACFPLGVLRSTKEVEEEREETETVKCAVRNAITNGQCFALKITRPMCKARETKEFASRTRINSSFALSCACTVLSGTDIAEANIIQFDNGALMRVYIFLGIVKIRDIYLERGREGGRKEKEKEGREKK